MYSTHSIPPLYINCYYRGTHWLTAAKNGQEIFDNNHRVVSQRGTSSGRFTFSAADAGDHKICFMPSSSSGRPGWLSMANYNGGIKLRLDMVIGETNQIESDDKEKLQDITTRVKDLNARLNDIRREQVFQRVSLKTLSLSFLSLLFMSGFRCLHKLHIFRNEKPSSETSPNLQTPASSAGSSSNSSSSALPAHGNSHIYAHSSSSKSLLEKDTN